MGIVRSTTIVVAAWAMMGCSSSLEVYRCERSEDCVSGAVLGVCQASRYCSFPDEDCEGGYRYSELSGGESNQCVAAGPLDAGLDAALSAPPVALIQAGILPCGKTSIEVDGSGSHAFDGKSVASYTWTITHADLGLVYDVTGEAGTLTPIRSFSFAGGIEAPRLNFTPYLDEFGAEIASTDDLRSLTHSVMDLPAGDYEFFATVSKEEEALGGETDVVVNIGSSISEAYSIDFELEIIELDFDLEEGLNAAVEFRFGIGGRYIVDNVSLIRRVDVGEWN